MSAPKERVKPIAGHALQNEGAPFNKARVRVRVSRSHSTTGGEGRALCECGVLSEPLYSAGQRKAWHRQHKLDVMRAGGAR